MRNWIFTPAGAACYLAFAWSVGVGVGLYASRPNPRPVWEDYCRVNQVSAYRCERLYYARGDTTWLASEPYGYQ